MESELTQAMETPRSPARLKDYVAMARPDHWVKHVFILPGIVLAYVAQPIAAGLAVHHVVVGLVAACLAASANYVLNEWLDARFDRHHASKSTRPAVLRDVSRGIVLAEVAGLAALALLAAAAVSSLFLYGIVALLVSGLIYNVEPLRTKDRAYLDVASEAVNNPIRLTLGWAMVSPTTLPPASVVLAYWMGGAFLMATKRLAEYRAAGASGELSTLALYRKSFASYTENKLLISAFLYAQLAAFFLAVFLIKYRIEYLLSMPFFGALFAIYFRVGLKRDSVAQHPERLFKETGLVAAALVLVAVLAVLSWVDIPQLERLAEPHFLAVD